jgi:hypothetical protein
MQDTATVSYTQNPNSIRVAVPLDPPEHRQLPRLRLLARTYLASLLGSSLQVHNYKYVSFRKTPTRFGKASYPTGRGASSLSLYVYVDISQNPRFMRLRQPGTSEEGHREAHHCCCQLASNLGLFRWSVGEVFSNTVPFSKMPKVCTWKRKWIIKSHAPLDSLTPDRHRVTGMRCT